MGVSVCQIVVQSGSSDTL